ncbi:NAD(P)H-dependent oxidoreductase [Helicobacter sp. MIT 14-3879]|uniref:NAD(P)H-dependent oxidoreductase n=1 Tax=Helicobacter sp. MIT 14-3879 TaxID=2040649 RepID=UPI000E1E4A57|nr:NAD(P)H-dependent oxidoreductase [Helicobacter sp. MIT 14-3879]RDU65157.1 NAD(P)H-dependent oxidoreductase [Helicobacter sp. MIT 14-3879]
MNKFISAMKFRHACKIFDENKKIPQSNFNDILESARLSPSSMGVEPTRILVIRDKQLREVLREACLNQIQLTSASEVVVLKCILQAIIPPSNYIDSMSYRRGKTDEERNKWIRIYGKFLKDKEAKGLNTRSWVEKQSYIMASSMMNCAAYMGIDSCAIEGFEEDKVNKILEIDTFKECVSVILTFGYRIKEQQKRYRLSIEDLVEYK